MGEGRISSGSKTPPSQGSGATAFPNFGGSPLSMTTPVNAERPCSTR